MLLAAISRYDGRSVEVSISDANQLGRRNLSPDAFRLLLGRRYNRTKKQGSRTDLTSGQSGTKSTTAEALAEEYGVGTRTVKRAGKFAKEVAAKPELQKAIQNKKPRSPFPGLWKRGGIELLDLWKVRLPRQHLFEFEH